MADVWVLHDWAQELVLAARWLAGGVSQVWWLGA